MENKKSFYGFIVALCCLLVPFRTVSAEEDGGQTPEVDFSDVSEVATEALLTQTTVQSMTTEQLAEQLLGETSVDDVSRAEGESYEVPALETSTEGDTSMEDSSQDRSEEVITDSDVSEGDVVSTTSSLSEEPASLMNQEMTQELPEESQTIASASINLDKNPYLTNPVASQATYQSGQNVAYSFQVTNATKQEQAMTVKLSLAQANLIKGEVKKATPVLAVGETYAFDNLTLPASWFANNTGYLVTVSVSDASDHLLAEKHVGLSVEEDWTVFPRYGVVAGSPNSDNSLLLENMEKYKQELALMSAMNINSYFFYDVYHTTTDPLPDLPRFKQDWNTWSDTYVETKSVSELVDTVHQLGAKAMLYNMIAADSNPSQPVFSKDKMVYNFYDEGYGDPKQVMTYSIDGQPFQIYYNPADKDWQDFISTKMLEAMKRYGFDGWQGDTIGDNRVTTAADAGKGDFEKSFMMSDTYAEFISRVKDVFGSDYYFTLNDINGENIYKTYQVPQDVIYTELWPNGRSAIKGRSQTSYGDLKARIDQAYDYTGQSLLVGAYMEEPEFDYDHDSLPLNGSARDVKAGKGFQADAALLVDAVVAASGGYHMSLAALANPKADLSLLQTAYYPTQTLTVSPEMLNRLYNYQQFVTAYENLLRGGLENENPDLISTQDNKGQLVSKDSTGTSGHQVWTFTKASENVKTIQLINLMGISAEWKNSDGFEENKTPQEQSNLTVSYKLPGYSREEVEVMATQTYLTSPDDWLSSSVLPLEASVYTDEDGNFGLQIQVPKLSLWDMIFIKTKLEKEEEIPLLDQTDEQPVSPQSSEITPQPELSEPSLPTTSPIEESQPSSDHDGGSAPQETWPEEIITEKDSQASSDTSQSEDVSPVIEENFGPQAEEVTEPVSPTESLSDRVQAEETQSHLEPTEVSPSVEVTLPSQNDTVSAEEIPSEVATDEPILVDFVSGDTFSNNYHDQSVEPYVPSSPKVTEIAENSSEKDDKALEQEHSFSLSPEYHQEAVSDKDTNKDSVLELTPLEETVEAPHQTDENGVTRLQESVDLVPKSQEEINPSIAEVADVSPTKDENEEMQPVNVNLTEASVLSPETDLVSVLVIQTEKTVYIQLPKRIETEKRDFSNDSEKPQRLTEEETSSRLPETSSKNSYILTFLGALTTISAFLLLRKTKKEKSIN
ncbi:glycoside hydrolase family 66 protein [Streptococcus saliviloxodontae]|uniref:Dextranase n=1 Tax=Streptococcus saliviloxodontae TaxID=1349416 RepID=A0ABS2PK27_9STRE|nr:glycoside hydrolase family 66 protein [Streptococcus saliviloxodontae]MBM7635380.1 dextranase [Streptococcus saliviloxodontae]